MRYKVLKGCVAGGRARRMGSIIDLDDAEATSLMNMGRVAPYDEKEPVEDRSIGLGEEKPKRRGRPPKASLEVR
jgi:hypothetical protein